MTFNVHLIGSPYQLYNNTVGVLVLPKETLHFFTKERFESFISDDCINLNGTGFLYTYNIEEKTLHFEKIVGEGYHSQYIGFWEETVSDSYFDALKHPTFERENSEFYLTLTRVDEGQLKEILDRASFTVYRNIDGVHRAIEEPIEKSIKEPDAYVDVTLIEPLGSRLIDEKTIEVYDCRRGRYTAIDPSALTLQDDLSYKLVVKIPNEPDNRFVLHYRGVKTPKHIINMISHQKSKDSQLSKRERISELLKCHKKLRTVDVEVVKIAIRDYLTSKDPIRYSMMQDITPSFGNQKH